MGHAVTAIASLGVLSALTLGAPASPGTSQQVQAAPTQKSVAPMPTHAVRGVVKSIGKSSLVITGSGKRAGEMTFVLGPSTHREGELTVGATVSVRYRLEGPTLMATAVSAQPEKQRATRTPNGGR
jgi:hypothetical protein